MSLRRFFPLLFLSLIVFLANHLQGSEPATKILVHYMPWFEAPPQSSKWGWHWTMGATKPNEVRNGQPAIAAHFAPLIGPYDSSDPAVIEYHLLTMKLAGIDGVIVDWYGLQDFRDYALLHRNTLALVEGLKRTNLSFAICYEDQTIPFLIEAGKLSPQNQVTHAKHEIDWMQQHWFSLPNYVKLQGKPVLLSFGQNGLSDDQWQQILQPLEQQLAYFSLHLKRRAAIGAFDWPLPKAALESKKEFSRRAKVWPVNIPVAFPRFVDYYAQAKVGPSYGNCPDNQGKTFQETFADSIKTKQPLVQIATWNDWGEGTQIEPSVEFQFRDLEVIQAFRRQEPNRAFSFQASDLRLPYELWQLRRRASPNVTSIELDQIAKDLAEGRIQQAAASIETMRLRP